MPVALNHIPTLFVASTLTLGGLIPFFDAEYVIREMGFPSRIATFEEAHTIMILGMARGTVVGLTLWTVYLQNKLEVADTVMVLLGSYLGLVDAYMSWEEGLPRNAWFRGLSGLAIAAYGWFGMTAWEW